MSRRHKADKRVINPDPKFGDLVVTKFMNAVMHHGKKSVAETIVYGALDRMQSRAKSDPIPGTAFFSSIRTRHSRRPVQSLSQCRYADRCQ